MSVYGWKTSTRAWKLLRPAARRMRTDATPAEDSLWARLRGRKLGGLRFRRQHTIGRFVVDFYCAEAKLVVEVDGPIHDHQIEEDRQRQHWLEAQGLRLLRFPNAAVERDLDSVLARILEAVAANPTP